MHARVLVYLATTNLNLNGLGALGKRSCVFRRKVHLEENMQEGYYGLVAAWWKVAAVEERKGIRHAFGQITDVKPCFFFCVV